MIKKLINKLFNKQSEVMSFKQGMDLTDLPVVTFNQNDNKFNFLLDTGSSDCIIDSNILDKLEYSMSNAENMLFGLDGVKRRAPICLISLFHNDMEYRYSYLISDMKEPFSHIKLETGVTLHGIIGSKFFNEFKYVLDFDKLIAYSKA